MRLWPTRQADHRQGYARHAAIHVTAAEQKVGVGDTADIQFHRQAWGTPVRMRAGATGVAGSDVN